MSVKCSNFDINKLTVNPANISGGNMLISFAQYNDPQLPHKIPIFMTNEITIVNKTGLTSTLHANPNTRAIKLPLSDQNLSKMLKSIDQKIPTHKNELFGNKANKYTYSPLIKKQIVNNNGLPEEIGYEYCTMKFSIDWDTKKINTGFFLNNGVTACKLQINSYNDLRTHIAPGCRVKIIFSINKIWATKTPHQNTFGLGLKVLQMEIFPKPKPQKVDYQNTYLFGNMSSVSTIYKTVPYPHNYEDLDELDEPEYSDNDYE